MPKNSTEKVKDCIHMVKKNLNIFLILKCFIKNISKKIVKIIIFTQTFVKKILYKKIFLKHVFKNSFILLWNKIPFFKTSEDTSNLLLI